MSYLYLLIHLLITLSFTPVYPFPIPVKEAKGVEMPKSLGREAMEFRKRPASELKCVRSHAMVRCGMERLDTWRQREARFQEKEVANKGSRH